jgi:thymidylate kinase
MQEVSKKSPGKLIVFYGINNLGKTTQVKKLVERLKNEGYPVEYLKYAIYDLEPSGPVLNGYLREGNPYNLSPREFQIFQAFNRTQYDPILRKKIENNAIIVAEDYIGTSIAWGMGNGVEKEFLVKINSHCLKEDLGILLDGERFESGIEKDHKHETDNELTDRVRQIHLDLGQEYGWKKINANQDIEEVHNDIWQLVNKII